MSITVTIAGSSYTYSSAGEKDWGDQNTSVVQAICNNGVWISDIKDNLTSTDTNKPLSAKQGKTLNTLLTGKLNISDLDSIPSNDSSTSVTSKWIYDNLYNASYNSGWFTLSNFQNASEPIIHSLNVPFKDLSYRIIYSPIGSDGTDNVDVTNIIGTYGSSYFGQWCKAGNNDNTIILRTAKDGGLSLSDTGIRDLITSYGNYKVIVKKNIYV